MIHYEEAGRGPVVVFLHGGALDRREWDDQMVLADRFRVIRVDARGHGRSETPMEPFRQCDDIAALLGHLGVERAALVGLSMGAGAATDTALEHPHLVSHLVVCGAGTNEPTFVDPWMLDIQRQMAEAQARLDAPAWIELALRQGVIGPYRDKAEKSVEDRCRRMITDTVSNHVKPGMTTPTHVKGSWERLGEIKVPALGVIGTLDAPDHHAMVERFVRNVPGARKAEIEGAAHVVNMDRPDAFNELLTQYL